MSDEDNGTKENESNPLCCCCSVQQKFYWEDQEFKEVFKNITPKKIRELANILKVEPKELVKCLEDHPNGIIANAVKNELQKSDPCSQQKLTKLASELNNTDIKEFIQKFQSSRWLECETAPCCCIILFIIALLIAIIFLIKENWIIGCIVIFLTFIVVICILLIKTEKSSKIKEIVKIINNFY